MTTHLKKVRHKRGHVCMGHGRVGKHRKHPGGRGNAGGQHHHRILMDRFHPGYFGKVGMRYYNKQKNPLLCPSINVDQLWHLAGSEALAAAKANKDAGKALCLDVTKKGFFKVLGKGDLPSVPLIVKSRFVSKGAEAKIKAAGGAVVLTA